MQKRKAPLIPLLVFSAAALAVLIGFALRARQRASDAERALANTYLHAYSELTAAVEELDGALRASLCTASPELLSSLCVDAYGASMAAQAAIGELPEGGRRLEQTAAFLAKAGDYARTLSRTAAVEGIDGSYESLRALSVCASGLHDALTQLQSALYDDQAVLSCADGDGTDCLAALETSLPPVPVLVYDGACSDHPEARSALALEGCAEVTENEARAAAGAFLSPESCALSLFSSGEGDIPSYGFRAERGGSEIFLRVSRVGGRVTDLLCARTPGTAVLSREEGIRAAQDFLEAQGYEGLSPVGSCEQDNILTVSFAGTAQEALCYADSVRVGVALDNGEILSFSSCGYLMNHTERDLPETLFPCEQAEAALSSRAQVSERALAFVPTAGGQEVLCHEFRCTDSDGKDLLLYVDAGTGEEYRILYLNDACAAPVF